MLKNLHSRKKVQYFLGLLIGFFFGFLLQKGGVCNYEIIMGQLLLRDFTVMKIILTTIVTGMLGVYAMREVGWVELHKKAGSLGTSVPGPLIFGVGPMLFSEWPEADHSISAGSFLRNRTFCLKSRLIFSLSTDY